MRPAAFGFLLVTACSKESASDRAVAPADRATSGPDATISLEEDSSTQPPPDNDHDAAVPPPSDAGFPDGGTATVDATVPLQGRCVLNADAGELAAYPSGVPCPTPTGHIIQCRRPDMTFALCGYSGWAKEDGGWGIEGACPVGTPCTVNSGAGTSYGSVAP